MQFLGDVANIQTGFLFRAKVPEDPKGNVVVVQMKDCSCFDGIAWDNCVRTKLDRVKESDWLKKGDILLATRGNNYQPIFVEFSQQDLLAVASPHFFVIRPKNTEILPEYLQWWLNLKQSQKYLIQNLEGSTTKSLRLPVLAELSIKIPSLAKQHVIVKMAKTLVQERKTLQKLIANNEKLMNALAQELISP